MTRDLMFLVTNLWEGDSHKSDTRATPYGIESLLYRVKPAPLYPLWPRLYCPGLPEGSSRLSGAERAGSESARLMNHHTKISNISKYGNDGRVDWPERQGGLIFVETGRAGSPQPQQNRYFI